MKKIICFIRPFWCNALVCITLIGFCILIGTEEIKAQNSIKIVGKVVERQSGEPVPSVHIYTKTLQRGAVTDEYGNFSISMQREDTLIFSSVGYERYTFSITQKDHQTNYEVVIKMDVKSYELEPVNVNAYQSLDEFKKDILDLNLPKESKGFELNIPRGYTLPPERPGDENLNPSVVARGPVSALYNAFSREAKERKKLAAFHKQHGNDEIVAARYNLEVVKRITALEEENAKSFMEWCTFEDEFIIRVSDYELTAAILHCLEEFTSTKLLDKK